MKSIGFFFRFFFGGGMSTTGNSRSGRRCALCSRREADRAREKGRGPPPQRAAVAGACRLSHAGCFKRH